MPHQIAQPELVYVNRGEPITAQWANDLTGRVNGRKFSLPLAQNGLLRASVKNTTGSTLQPNSLIGIKYATIPFAEGVVLYETELGIEAPFTVTNGPYQVLSNHSFSPISLSSPQLVAADLTVTTWPVGQRVARKADGAVVTRGYHSNLICLADIDVDDLVLIHEQLSPVRPWVHFKLNEAMLAATAFDTSPSATSARVWLEDISDPALPLIDSGDDIDVYNRTDQAGVDASYGRAEWTGSKWEAYVLDCGA